MLLTLCPNRQREWGTQMQKWLREKNCLTEGPVWKGHSQHGWVHGEWPGLSHTFFLYILASQMAKFSQIAEVRVKMVDLEWAKVWCPAQLSIYMRKVTVYYFDTTKPILIRNLGTLVKNKNDTYLLLQKTASLIMLITQIENFWRISNNH